MATVTLPDEKRALPGDFNFTESCEDEGEEEEGCIVVNIQQRHIDAGVVGSMHACPIAHAVNEMKLDDVDDWFVDNTGAVVSETIVNKWDYYYWLDSAGEKFLVAFDAKEPVQPCQIRILGEDL